MCGSHSDGVPAQPGFVCMPHVQIHWWCELKPCTAPAPAPARGAPPGSAGLYRTYCILVSERPRDLWLATFAHCPSHPAICQRPLFTARVEQSYGGRVADFTTACSMMMKIDMPLRLLTWGKVGQRTILQHYCTTLAARSCVQELHIRFRVLVSLRLSWTS